MKTINFPEVIGAIDLSFDCPKCGETVKPDALLVLPEPNYAADSHVDSIVCDEEDVICTACGEMFHVQYGAGHSGSYCQIEELEEDADVSAKIVCVE